MTQRLKRIDLDDEQQWAAIAPDEYVSAAVHRMLNQLNTIQFVMDAVNEPVVLAALEKVPSEMLEDMDLPELMGDAAASCSSLIRALKQLHRFNEFKREQASGSTPPD
jgi:hypothetical protein